MADKKYRSVEGVLTQYDMNFHELLEFCNVRARVEHVNGEWKVFGIMSQTWRNGEAASDLL